MTHNNLFFTFFTVWIALAIASGFFYWAAEVETKRRWHPRLVVGSGLLFLVFVFLMMPLWPTAVIAVPGVALIAYLNLTRTKFCGRCGTMLISQNWFSKLDFCQKCGAALTGGTPRA